MRSGWFYERDGVRTRDGLRAYCNLGVSLPPGKTPMEMKVPDAEGTAFVVLDVSLAQQNVSVEVGPIEITSR